MLFSSRNSCCDIRKNAPKSCTSSIHPCQNSTFPIQAKIQLQIQKQKQMQNRLLDVHILPVPSHPITIRIEFNIPNVFSLSTCWYWMIFFSILLENSKLRIPECCSVFTAISITMTMSIVVVLPLSLSCVSTWIHRLHMINHTCMIEFIESWGLPI